MPKPISYKANSIIYFKGDDGDKIFILNSGKVSLNYNDIETGQEIRELIKTGEFFGVKSALGRFPREETAAVLQDSIVLAFTISEYEDFASKNTRIIMKMLKVFSNQLRRIHKQVQNLLSSGERSVDAEAGLFSIGEYYYRAKKYRQALYAFQRYLTYYPSGKYAGKAEQFIEKTENDAQVSPRSGGSESVPSSGAPSQGKTMSDAAKSYYNAVSLFSQQKNAEALKEFQKILVQSTDEEYKAKAFFEIGRCYFALGKYQDCIAHFSTMLQKYPKHPDLVDSLFYVGSSHEKNGDKDKALGIFSKILTMASSDTPLYRKTKKAITEIGERK